MKLNFFSSGNERSRKYKKNTIILILCQVLSLASSMLLVPIVLNYLGVQEYGIWITLTTIIAWFSFFDIGLGNGLRNKYAEAKAKGHFHDIKLYVSTTFFSLTGFSIIIFILFSTVALFINWSTVLAAPLDMAPQLKYLAIFIAATLSFRFFVNIVSNILTADQEPAKVAIINLLSNLLSLSGVYIISKLFPPNLVTLGICLSLCQIIPLTVAFFYYFNTRYKEIFPRWSYFSVKHVRSILSLGVRFFLIQMTALILFQTNNIIIAHTCGLSDVTEFNISYKYISVLHIFFMTILTPLWSASTDAYFKGDVAWLKNSTNKLNLIWVLTLLGGILLVITSSFLYKIWLRGTLNPNFLLLSLLLLYFACLMRSNVYRSFMNGVGKIRMQFYVTLTQSILHIPIAIYMGKLFGINGVVITMILSTFINSIWEPIQFNRIINNKAYGIWNR
jgi:O-antigen/teichoic acid export membrane protein